MLGSHLNSAEFGLGWASHPHDIRHGLGLGLLRAEEVYLSSQPLPSVYCMACTLSWAAMGGTSLTSSIDAASEKTRYRARSMGPRAGLGAVSCVDLSSIVRLE